MRSAHHGRAFYNENDSRAAAWLRELVARNLIAPGDVDERSITELVGADLADYTQVHLFAGIGGWSRALRLAGWPDARPAWTGSCPCQPFSAAGAQGGFDDARHLWPHMFRLARECEPPVVFGEQVASPLGRDWLDLVFADLEGAGYACGAADLCAASVGAPHRRQRLYWVANHADERHEWDGDTWPGRSGLVDDSERGGMVHPDLSRPQGRGLLGAARRGDNLAECVAGADDVGGLAEHSGDGRREGNTHGGGSGARSASRPESGFGGGDADGGLGDTRRECYELRRKFGVMGCAPSAEQGEASQREWGRDAAGNSDAHNFWSDVEFLSCRDGRARPAQPGIFPLVAGISARMGRSRDPSEPVDADATPEARTMRLRGYGNAIVPQVAAEFVGAYLDARDLRSES